MRFRSILPDNPGLTLLVSAALFMENLDSTIVVTALPDMGRTFGVQAVDVTVGILAYTLTLAVLIPVSGWVADRFGTRTTFSIAVAVFVLGSILAGISNSLLWFAVAEVIQGTGGALMVPVGRLLILRGTEKHDIAKALSAIVWPALLAPVLGPPLGGFITHYFEWRWIFFCNVPLGMCVFYFARKLIPSDDTEEARPFDWIGFVLTGSACIAFILALDLVSRKPSSVPVILGCFVLACGASGAAIIHARRSPHPMLDLWALRLPTYSVGIVWGALFRISVGALPFLLPLLFQFRFGLNPFQAGLLLLAVFAGNFLTKFFTVQTLRAFPYRSTLLVNGCLNFAVVLACAFLSPGVPFALIAVLLFLSGVTRSMQFTALTTLAFSDVPKAHMSGASSLASVGQQLTTGLGVALGAALLRVGDLVQPGEPGLLSPFSFRIAFLVVAFLSLCSALKALSLPEDAGDQVRLARKSEDAASSPPERAVRP